MAKKKTVETVAKEVAVGPMFPTTALIPDGRLSVDSDAVRTFNELVEKGRNKEKISMKKFGTLPDSLQTYIRKNFPMSLN